ncbi:MAG: hypothetical protein LBL07_06170 [Tannerella sp.]|jgi:hypothetical protein|nr:hypothetical protein [Tannerella sp.]
MAKKDLRKVVFEVSTEIQLTYDRHSKEFKKAFESYREVIDRSASETDMLQYIAWYVACYGTESLIEGVGYISVEGKKKGDADNWCGVDIGDNFNINDKPEFHATEMGF